MGISGVRVIDAFDIKKLRSTLKSSLNSPELSVIVVRGACSVRPLRRSEPMGIDTEKCNQCEVCLMLGCPALQSRDGQVCIDATLCVGDVCAICRQICARQAIALHSEIGVIESR